MRTHIVNLLRWSQKYTKTDMTYLAKGGTWVLFAQGLVFLLSFLLIWVFANLLSPELYGQYKFLTTALTLLAITTLPGMNTAIVRAVAKGNSGIIPKALRTRVRFGLIGTAFAFILASYYFIQDNHTLGWLFILTALFVPFYQSYAIAPFYHNGRKDYRNYTTSAVVRRAVIVLSTIAAIIISKNIFVILAAYLVSTAVANFAVYIYTIKRFPLSDSEDEETIPYGKKLSLMTAISTISGHVDKIALWYLAGSAQVAIYAMVIALPNEIRSAFANIGILALPKMANRGKAELRESMLRKLSIYFLASIPVVLAYVFFSSYLFNLFLPQYAEYVHYSQIASLFILTTPSVLLIQYFHATLNARALYINQFILPILVIILFFILIPIFGILGAIFALLGKQMFGFLILLFLFIKDW